MQMLARQAIDPRCLGDREMTADDFEDNHPCLGHEPRLSPMTRLICHLCRELTHPFAHDEQF
jgi:hypothetical protein